MSVTSIDGRIVAPDDAHIPVSDEGLLRGDGVFEVIRLYAGRPFALDEHLARMRASSQNLRLPVDVDAVRRDVDAVLAAAPPEDAQLRIVATRGGRRIVIHEPLADASEPLALALVTYAPVRILDGVKSLSYGSNMLATRLAEERGFDEALLVTPHGRILEAPTSSLFYVLDAMLWTPPLEDHILDSITRRKLLEITGARERVTATDDVRRMAEAFLASTTREVQPVRAIEDHALEAPGPFTREAARALRDRIETELSPRV